MILYDGHLATPISASPPPVDARRCAALRLLARVVKSCAGGWGVGDAREPRGGTRMWAVLPREGARA